jgi:hypothetical protein
MLTVDGQSNRQCRLSRGRLARLLQGQRYSVALVVGFAAWELQKPFGNNRIPPWSTLCRPRLVPGAH